MRVKFEMTLGGAYGLHQHVLFQNKFNWVGKKCSCWFITLSSHWNMLNYTSELSFQILTAPKNAGLHFSNTVLTQKYKISLFIIFKVLSKLIARYSIFFNNPYFLPHLVGRMLVSAPKNAGF